MKKNDNKRNEIKKRILNIKVSQLLKMYKYRLTFKETKEIIIILLVSLASVLLVYDNAAIAFHKDLVNQISSSEIMAFKNISGDGSYEYSNKGEEYPLFEEEVNALKNIENVSHLFPRFDCYLMNIINEEGDIEARDETKFLEKMKIKENGVVLNKDMNQLLSSYSIVIETYSPEVNYQDKLEYGNTKEKGIILSKNLYNKFFDESIKENLSLYFPLHIPIYNLDGISEVSSEESIKTYQANSIGTKVIWEELPIVGVLKEETLYDNDSTSINIIYVNQDIIEEYYKQYKKDDSYTVYYVLSEKDDKLLEFINEVPEEYKDNIQQVIKVTPYQPNCYILYMNSIDNLEEGLSNIQAAGLDAKNIYINAKSLQASLNSIQKGIKFVGISVVIVLIYIEYMMKNKSISEEKKTITFLKNMGFKHKDIQSFRMKNVYIQFFCRFIICLVLSIIFILLIRIFFLSNTVISLELLFYLFILCFCLDICLSFLIYRKDKKTCLK